MANSMNDWLNQFPPAGRVLNEKERGHVDKKPQSGLGRKSLEKMDSQLTLDIHGMTRLEAEKELVSFIKLCRQRKIKRGLIIHGKGKHSEGRAVLKPMVLQFMNNNSEIAEFGSARKNEGGAGATWFSLTIFPGK